METENPVEKTEESKAEEIRASIDDSDLFKEEDEPSEYAEDKMEPIDDNLICPI
jgi:hypothetical protein